MRALHFARALHELGFAVELFVSDRGPARAAVGLEAVGLEQVEFHPPRAADRVRGLASVAAGRPLQTLPYRSRGLEAAAGARMASMGERDVVLVQLARHAPLVERLLRERRPDGPTIVVDLIDVLSLNFRRRAQIQGGVLGPLWRAEARRLQRTEAELVRRSDAITVVCERDRRELVRLEEVAATRAHTTPLPVAVSDDPVEVAPSARGRSDGHRRLVFTGNLGYFVNDHAIRAFLDRVWPRLRTLRPDVELVVAGARPTRALRHACARAEVTLRPDPPDLREILRTADLALAPLVGGAGVPVKVLEAWSEGVPVVASEWCARGLLFEGERVEDIDEALFRVPDLEDADAFAALIAGALDREQDARARAHAGRARLARLHSFAAFRDAVKALVEAARADGGSGAA